MKRKSNAIAACILSSVFLASGVQAADIVKEKSDSPESLNALSALFTAHNPLKEPVLFISHDMLQKEMDETGLPSSLPGATKALRQIVQGKTGRWPDRALTASFIDDLAKGNMMALRTPKEFYGYDPANAVCFVSAVPERSYKTTDILSFFNNDQLLSLARLEKNGIFLNELEFGITRDLISRYMKLHEGTHCIDPWFKTKILTDIHTSSWQNFQATSTARVKEIRYINMEETFSDVFSILKLAQEGHINAGRDIAAFRALIQQVSSPYQAEGTGIHEWLYQKTGGQIDIRSDGWIDNRAFIPVEKLRHYTIPGLLAAHEFIQKQGAEKMAAMTMEDIMNKARDITEKTALSNDEHRGLAYAMFTALRDRIGPAKGQAAKSRATPITAEQIVTGQKALEAYNAILNTAIAAVTPQNKKPTLPEPRP